MVRAAESVRYCAPRQIQLTIVGPRCRYVLRPAESFTRQAQRMKCIFLEDAFRARKQPYRSHNLAVGHADLDRGANCGGNRQAAFALAQRSESRKLAFHRGKNRSGECGQGKRLGVTSTGNQGPGGGDRLFLPSCGKTMDRSVSEIFPESRRRLGICARPQGHDGYGAIRPC